MVDCHTHTTFSDDSIIKPEEGVVAAIKAGLKGIIFTDHREFDYANPDFKFDFDVNARAAVFNPLKEKYHSKLKILQGVEIGVQPHILDSLNDFVGNNKLDFVLASVHSVDHQDIGCSCYHENKTVKSIYKRYLEEVLFAVTNFKNYDSVGHIGYVRRYVNSDDRSMPFGEYHDIIDQILKTIIHDGKGIEINTSGLRQGLGTPIPDFDIIKRFFDLGGEIITIGSDSHKPGDIGSNFEIIRIQLLKIGIEYATYFSERNPEFYSLKK